MTIRLHPSMATVRQTHGSRFRTDLLDPLLVLHEIAFSPWFEPVRRAGLARPDPVAFDAVLRREVDRLRVLASDQTRGSGSVPANSQQLSELLTRYPRLAPSPARDGGSALAIATAALHGFLASDARLRFARVGDPTVSAIVVARNRAELTCRALRSLLADESIPLEVVVVDNASTDETTDVLARCDGLTVARNDANLGFGPAVNQACALAKGEYLLLLNSDAEVLPGSISSALRTICDRCGRSGRTADSRGWTPSGGGEHCVARRLFVWVRPWGHAVCADVQLRARRRLLFGGVAPTRRDCFVDLGGFDPAYAPAYYEDVDYCFRLRGAGWRVVYDPTFIARHTEFGSSGSPDEALARQSRNRGTFVEKHRRALAAQHSPQEASPLEGRMVPPRGLRILYIDDQVPRDALGAGLPRARQVLRTLVGLGDFVTMYPLVYCEESSPGLREIPRTIEVMKGYGPERLWEILRERSGYYDRVIVSRPHNFQTFRSVIGENTEQIAIGTVIYDAEAIFTQRETDLNVCAARPSPLVRSVSTPKSISPGPPTSSSACLIRTARPSRLRAARPW